MARVSPKRGFHCQGRLASNRRNSTTETQRTQRKANLGGSPQSRLRPISPFSYVGQGHKVLKEERLSVKIPSVIFSVSSVVEFRSGGGSGIRTHGPFRVSGFQDRCNKPLYHPSTIAPPRGKSRLVRPNYVIEEAGVNGKRMMSSPGKGALQQAGSSSAGATSL